MLFVLVSTVLSLLWLLHRATRLLQIPIPTLVQLLGIDIPAPPHVCLDSVSSDSVTLHWSLPDRASSVAKHVIQMNGQNVGESEKRETSVTITGLNPDQVYGVRVLAVNSNHYSAAGQLIRLRTRRKSEDLILTNIQPVAHETIESTTKCMYIKDERMPKNAETAVVTSFKRGANRSNRHSSPSHRNKHDISSFTAATQPYTIESLAAELEQIRTEISETIAQQTHAEEDYVTTEQTLRAELETLREKRKEEDAARAQMRSETKALEESKRTLEAQKTKVEKAVKQKLDSIQRVENDFKKWESDMTTAAQRKSELERLSVELEKNLQLREQKSKTIINDGHKQIAQIEDEIRGLVSKIKKAESEKSYSKGEDSAENAFAKLVHSEDAEDLRLEKIWKEVQKSLELRYVNIFEQYREAEEKLRKTHQVFSLVSSQGSIPSPEVTKSAKRRNRTRNKQRQANAVSSPISSYPIHDPRFPDASTFNNLQNSLHFNSPAVPPALSSTSSLSGLGFTNFNSSGINFFAEPMEDAITPTTEDLIGGPTSPSVNMLLPSNLFVAEDSAPSDLEIDTVDSPGGSISRINSGSGDLEFDALFGMPGTPLSQHQSQMSADTPPSSNVSNLVLSASRPISQYSHMGLPNNSSSSLSLLSRGGVAGSGGTSGPGGGSFFPTDSNLKNVTMLSDSSSGLPSRASTDPGSPLIPDSASLSLLDNLSMTPSPSSGGGGQHTPDMLIPGHMSNIAGSTPIARYSNRRQSGTGSSLLSMFNMTSGSSGDDTGAEPILNEEPNGGTPAPFTGFGNLTKRSPSKLPLFGSVSAIGNSIGSIGRKKDSFDSGTSSSPTNHRITPEEFVLGPDVPRTPGRRFTSLFSFSKQRPGAGIRTTSGDGSTADEEETSAKLAPIGTRRQPNLFKPIFGIAESDQLGSTSGSTRSGFGSQMGSLFTAPMFTRRNGDAGSASGQGQGQPSSSGRGTKGIWDFTKSEGNRSSNW
ncbi:uncharacterized protein V1516DRAFT_624769 [Lipomyces oligophaga]|uniref:uncharacterized protein n=1 Tax=Lipomyces oligophaga TaxID=45792 RepID=UPI0034CEDE82